MTNTFESVDAYIDSSAPENREAMRKLRNILREVLVPLGYEEAISYGMIGYVVPRSIYPDGYHCDRSLPLPFINLASRSDGISLYHMGIACDDTLRDWWISEYENVMNGKINLGKGCIKFKKVKEIPFELVRELASKMTPKSWIEHYESRYLK